MKRFITLISSLLLVFNIAYAVPVSPARAEAAAKQYLKVKTGRTVNLKPIEEVRTLTKGAAEHPDFYAFESDRGGFVIIAGDDAVSPVIGWSRTGTFTFEGMPENITAWFDMWRNIIKDVREGRLEPQSEACSEWESVEKGRTLLYDEGEKILETASWNQTDPYNKYCPNGSVAGCVAVATAIRLRYHQWPEAGQGELPAYDYEDDGGTKHHEDAITLGHEYHWDKMPLKLKDESTEEEINEVATLIHETGVMVQSYYSPEGTGAFASDVYDNIAKYFFYDASAIDYYPVYFRKDEWCRMIMDNLDNVGPVLYAGQGKEGGHAFVIDGYSEKGQFHINWGWGGRNNAFFTYPSFKEYTSGQHATFNLKKDEGGSKVDFLAIDGNGDGHGLTASVEEFQLDEQFGFRCEYLFNLGSRPFNGQLALAVIHRDGSMGEIVSLNDDFTCPSLQGYGIYDDECKLTEELFIGDRLCLWYRSENTPEWTIIRANVEQGDAAEIPVADQQFLDEVTSFKYTSETGELVISTKKDAEWKIEDTSGNSYTDGVSFKDGELVISTKQFRLKSYFITLTKGRDSKTVEFVFGS